LKTKYSVLEALKQNAESFKAIRKTLYLKRHLLTKLKLLGPFYHWREVLIEAKLTETAMWFRHHILPRMVTRQCFSALKLHHTDHKIDRVRTKVIKERARCMLKRKIFETMLGKMKTTFELNSKAQQIRAGKALKALRIYLFALQKECIILKDKRTMRD